MKNNNYIFLGNINFLILLLVLFFSVIDLIKRVCDYNMNIFDLWPEVNQTFYDIKNEDSIVRIEWSGNYAEDYNFLADCYIQCAYLVAKEIGGKHNNRKSDMWFLPCIYMFRQGIELILKALICKNKKRGKYIQPLFEQYKHNLSGLFEKYISVKKDYLNEIEKRWIISYLKSLENVDANSDLFRFPFNDEFLNKYRNKFLNVCGMINSIIQCYLTLKKCWDMEAGNNHLQKIDTKKSREFLQFASHGIGNCYLWKAFNSDEFYKQIQGYSEVAEFLLLKCKLLSNKEKAYPIIFLQRNLLELSLKRLLLKNLKFRVNRSKARSHLLYKDLWKSVKPILEFYFEKNEKETPIFELLESYLLEISKIDKNGDVFRYPTTYSLQYKFDKKIIDIKHIYCYMQAISNFLDANESVLSEISDNELGYYND